MGRTFQGDLRFALIAGAKAKLQMCAAAELSLRELAREIGVTHVAAYRHFADRDALLTAVAVADFEEMGSTIRKSIASSDDAFVQAGVAYVTFALSRPHRFRSMFVQLGRGDAALKTAASAVLGQVEPLLGPDVDDRAARAIATWAAVHGLACLTIDGAVPDNMPPPLEMARAIQKLSR